MSLQIASPFQQFFDRDGSPLDNGFVYVGTANLNPETNPLTIYYDDALTIPAAQPLRTSNGYIVRNGSPARLYTSQEDFSLTVRDKNGVLVFTVADATSLSNFVSQLAAGSGSSLVGYNQGGVGAVDRTVQSRLRDYVSVKDFGAVGDGLADDTTAIQAAIDTGSDLYFPPGNYLITSTLSFAQTNKSYIGAGKDSSLITLSGSGLKRLASVTGSRVTFEAIGFAGDTGANRPSISIGAIFLAGGAAGVRFYDCLFTSFSGRWGSNPNPAQESIDVYAVEIDANGVNDFRFESCRFSNITNEVDLGQPAGLGGGFCGGIYLYKDNAASVINPSSGEIIDCQFSEMATLRPDGSPNSNINQTDADAIRTQVVAASDDDKVYRVRISGCRFFNVQKSAVKSSGTAGLVIEDSQIYSYRSDVDMQAAIRVQWTKSATIRNTFCRGRFYSLVVVIGKDIVVDGVYFLGRSSADYFSASGSVFQALDTGFTESNLVFRNVYVNKAPQLFIQIGQPSGEIFANDNITIENVVARLCAPNNDPNFAFIDIRKTKRVRLSNIKIDDRDVGNILDAIRLRDCVEVYVDDTQVDCTRRGLTVDRIAASLAPQLADVSVSNLSVWRGNHLTDPNTAVVSIRGDQTPSTPRIDNIRINGVYVSMLGTSVPNNSLALIVEAMGGTVYDVTCYVRNDGTNTDFNTGFSILGCTKLFASTLAMIFETGISPTAALTPAVGVVGGGEVKVSGVMSASDGVFALNCNRVVLSDVTCANGQTPATDLGGNTNYQAINCVAF